jgi:thioredoxin-like negative regulator of GroEL
VRIVKINTDKHEELAEKFKVNEVPTIFIVKGSGKPKRIKGSTARDIFAAI